MARNFTDEYIRRQFYIVGLSYGEANQFISTLDSTNATVTATLYAAFPKITETRSLSIGQRNQIDTLANRITRIRGRAVADYRFTFEKALAELVGTETAFDGRQFESLPETDGDDVLVPPASVIAPAIIALGIFDGRTIDEWFNGFVVGDAARIRQSLAASINNGLSTDQAIKSLLGSKNLGYKDGALNTSRASARTLARTVWNGVSNLAHRAFNRANSGLIAYEEYTAILDGKTTFICASLDGNKYEVGLGPYPPLHRNCRSHRYPVPNLLVHPESVTDRPFVRDTRTDKELQKDFRADAKRRVGGDRWSRLSSREINAEIRVEKDRWVKANVGTVPSTVTWTEWFSRQPAQFKRDYLGSTRYKAYLNGTKISGFVAPTGRPWTIEQLKKRGIV